VQDLSKYPSLILRSDSGQLTELTVENLRVQKQIAIIKFKSIDNIGRAEEYIGCDVGVFEDRLPETENGEYYIRDLIGMDVFSDAGEQLGVLSDVLETPANDIYQVAADDRELLIPALTEVIIKVDPEKRIITVRLIEGLLDL
jgi:16S rRNA processing protein RimM